MTAYRADAQISNPSTKWISLILRRVNPQLKELPVTISLQTAINVVQILLALFT
jgi:hypothetical protein